MNESQLKTLVKSILEMKRENAKILSEIREIKSELRNLLNENAKSVPISPQTKLVPKKGNGSGSPFSKSSYLSEIFQEITPFEEDENNVKSILDENFTNADDPVARVMNKIQNTDFKRVLDVMERTSSNKMRST
jgi:hypothetical protein